MSRESQTQPIKIYAEGKFIDPSLSIKLLGVIFDKNLNWNSFVSILVSQLANRLTTLRQLAKHSSFKVMRTISTALIIGKINFALTLYGGLFDYQKQKLQSILITAAKICIGKSSFKMSTRTLMKK